MRRTSRRDEARCPADVGTSIVTSATVDKLVVDPPVEAATAAEDRPDSGRSAKRTVHAPAASRAAAKDDEVDDGERGGGRGRQRPTAGRADASREHTAQMREHARELQKVRGTP